VVICDALLRAFERALIDRTPDERDFDRPDPDRLAPADLPRIDVDFDRCDRFVAAISYLP
jgi:hypothetical protein